MFLRVALRAARVVPRSLSIRVSSRLPRLRRAGRLFHFVAARAASYRIQAHASHAQHCCAARRAGQIINRASLDLDLIEIRKKQQNDFVTEVDKAAEDAIIETLKTAYPDHAILAEESGESENESEFKWIIDPLDGTTNFIHGFPYYCVSIALEHKGVVTQAVVYDPNKNDLFTATRGRGAYLNDRRIRVGRRDRLSDALVGTGFPFRERTASMPTRASSPK